ncbi:MAG: PrsW family glutamic-type intramembrane protease [Lentimicrobium sp.]|nr:PrsW family glutamic-type intramembrane protease [Lentimicrobium sp.]
MKEAASLLISPIIFLFLYLYLRYKYPQGQFRLLFKTFGLGLLMAVPVILADQLAHYLNIDGALSIRRMFMYSFVFVGFVTEISKFIPLYSFVMKHKTFNGAPDGIIYTIAISTGLTSIYSIYYLYFGLHVVGDTILMFAVGPVSALLAVILGFFAGMGKVRKNKFIDSMTGIGAAAFFHGLYRFTILSNDHLFYYLVSGGILFIALILLRKSLTTPLDSY